MSTKTDTKQEDTDPIRILGRNPITRKQYVEYEKNRQYHIFTTRYTTSTWLENQTFCRKHKYPSAYFAPFPIPKKVPDKASFFVLEMNNDTNQIMGIGLTSNEPRQHKYVVYENPYYNRVTYLGKSRISRESIFNIVLLQESDETINHDNNQEIQEIRRFWENLEYFCFKGKGHLKRGQGLTSFPVATILNVQPHVDIISQLIQLFKNKKEREKKHNITSPYSNIPET
jgi:hypothetical protein